MSKVTRTTFAGLAWVAIAIGLVTGAQAEQVVPKAQQEALRKALEAPGTQFKVGEVRFSDISGLYEVQYINGPLVYATADGKHFVAGDLYTVGPAGLINVTEKRRDAQRKMRMADVPVDDMIVFAPEKPARAVINVFTDVTCFYCQKLHREVPQLNASGVEVRYLAYPRAGVESDGFRKLASAWCADNQQDALTRLKAQKSVPENVCKDNPINNQYQLGQELGVRGTPAIVTQDGQMIPGYRSAVDLLATLGLK